MDPVLIVGAGIVGLTLGQALKQVSPVTPYTPSISKH